MIRVAFFVKLDDSWLGGVNYFRNLIRAIRATKEIAITPIIFTSKTIDKKLISDFLDVEIIQSDIFERWTSAWILRKFDNRLFFRDRSLDKLCVRHHIDLISHTTHLGGKLETPVLAWIPDFQHRHLPELFIKKELKSRDYSYRVLCDYCDGIIVSSYDAKKDLQLFDPKAEEKAHVLQFAVEPILNTGIPREEIEAIYGFKGKYFYVPNQFWAHKNHIILLEAIKILKKQGRKICIICTGNTLDTRNPLYFQEIENFIRDNNLAGEFVILGKIPYLHVITLGKHCTALINPSLFEGWSTTVEEAKSLGKRIILSDIPVHREQNPLGGVYFNPHNPEELAEKLWGVWETSEKQILSQSEIDDDLVRRRISFAKAYEKIVFSIINP